mgnify:FL=1
MWFKIEVIPYGQKTLFLPADMVRECGPVAAVKFGGRSIRASIQPRDDLKLPRRNSFASPGRIILSDKLREELLLADVPVYRVKLDRGRLVFGPVIGLLLGSATQRYNPVHMMKYSDRFGIYHRIGGLVYAFAPKLINWREQDAYGLYYNHIKRGWEYGRFPLPEVIYRRDFHTDPEVIRQLITYTGGRLFNSYRFSKDEFYRYLKGNRRLKKHLPPTAPVQGFSQLKKFIDHYQKVILKPAHLSRGRGMCIVEKVGAGYTVHDFRTKEPTVYELYHDKLLENFFAVYQDLFEQYLVQRYIPFAKIDGAPFDIRVVMQKRPDWQWECSGMECRVANNGYLTNISRGGYALPLAEGLKQAFPMGYTGLRERMEELCQEFCRCLDRSGEHFAELGLDLAFDTEKKLWLIEANVFPSFKGFKRMDPETYLSIRYRPMLYACSLTEFGVATGGP